MIPLFFALIIGGGILLIGIWAVLKVTFGGYLEKENKRLEKKNERLREEVERGFKKGIMLPPEEDYTEDESEETSEARGIPSSAVMDAEDDEEE